MINKNSSIGYIEDRLGALYDSVAKEGHFKILVDKYQSLTEQTAEKMAFAEGEEYEQLKKELQEYSDMIGVYQNFLLEQTSLRRNQMANLRKYAEGESADELHCSLKHSIGEAMKSFEVYQATASQEDFEIYWQAQLMLNAILNAYFGFDLPPCSACISDMLKEKSK